VTPEEFIELMANAAAVDTSEVQPLTAAQLFHETPDAPTVPALDVLPGTRLADGQPTVVVAEFPIIGATFGVGPKGILRVGLLVERHEKYAAMPITDFPGIQLMVQVTRPLIPGFDEGYGELTDAEFR
jgi:hypothetical protein